MAGEEVISYQLPATRGQENPIAEDWGLKAKKLAAGIGFCAIGALAFGEEHEVLPNWLPG